MVLANYGYMDGSGEYFICINIDHCSGCKKNCISACPSHVFAAAEDDYGDLVVMVKDGARKRLKYLCAECKSGKNAVLPCLSACPYGALKHSW